MGINEDFLKNEIFTNKPNNWMVHSHGFYNTALTLIDCPKNIPTYISSKDIFLNQYNYKIAIYLLCHSIELLLKSLIEIYYESPEASKSPMDYSHGACAMAIALINSGVVVISQEEKEILKLVDIYLKWFGRYHSPKNVSSVSRTLSEDYTKPDLNKMVEFKYALDPETHIKLKNLYEVLMSKIPEEYFPLTYFPLEYLHHEAKV